MNHITIAQAVIIGLLQGGIYSIIAAGANIYFGVMRIVNFAHGEFLTLAMYIGFILVSSLHVPIYLAAVICALVMFMIGYLFQMGLLNRLLSKDKERTPGSLFLFSLGVGMMLKNGIQIIFGTQPKVTNTLVSGMTIHVGELIISLPRLIVLAIAVAAIWGLSVFLKKTETGRALQAVSQNRQVALLMGINQKSIYCLAFGIGIGLVGVAGSAMLPFMTLTPNVGSPYGLLAFVLIVLGGMGSIKGSLVAGLAIGMIEALGTLFISTAYAKSLVYVIFVLMLLIRPTGLFGKEKS